MKIQIKTIARTMILMSLVLNAACSLKSQAPAAAQSNQVTQGTSPIQYDENAKIATTIPPVSQALTRIQTVFGGNVVPNGSNNNPNAFQSAISQAFTNAPTSALPNLYGNSGANASQQMAWGACVQVSQMATTSALFTQWGLKTNVAVASQTPAFISMVDNIFQNASGIPVGTNPSVIPTLWTSYNQIMTSYLSSLANLNLTFQQTVANSCFVALIGGIQTLGY
jgi:hypothetical protein